MNRAVLPHMRRHGSGLVVHISSGAGRVGIPGLGFYSATEFALEAYRHELASQGIESAIVEPSAFFTPLFQKQEEAGDTLRSSSYGSGKRHTKEPFEATHLLAVEFTRSRRFRSQSDRIAGWRPPASSHGRVACRFVWRAQLLLRATPKGRPQLGW